MGERVELAVLGAGPAAVSAARAAVRNGIPAVLIAPVATARPGLHELLATSARPAFDALGLGPETIGRAEALDRTVFRWGRADTAEHATPGGSAAIIDRAEFDEALRDGTHALGIPHIGTRVVDWERDGDGWRLGLQNGSPIRASRVVVATGRGSRLLQRAGARRRIRHRMVALIQRVPTAALAGRMIVDPTPTGWWYAMGRADGATVGFVTDADLLVGGPDRASATWRREREDRPWVPGSGELELRPAVVADVDPAGAGGILPVGDAALALDPLSGHGLRFALESGIRAVLEPDAYPGWLAAEQRRHAKAERALYARETRFAGEAFWSRRTRTMER